MRQACALDPALLAWNAPQLANPCPLLTHCSSACWWLRGAMSNAGVGSLGSACLPVSRGAGHLSHGPTEPPKRL